jgi:hypothetical protein
MTARRWTMPSSIIPEKLALAAREAAAALSMSERTLWAHTVPRGSIPALRVGSRVLYPVDGLKSWLAAQTGAVEQKGGDHE